MEKIFQEVKCGFSISNESILLEDEYTKKLNILKKYYNKNWLQDYELDEKKLLPKDLKRGVLSQDELYNLLMELKVQ
ncbi:MAG: DUF4298 domain-containing protein [Spirochaetaceae bacterium]|nr:DUF4298 domain-containing protein [Spirochaetaceae bacterium]